MEKIFNVKNSADMRLPVKSNLVNFSLLSEIACPAAFRSFSIKYVCDGVEKYEVNGNTYHIKSNEYLLANHFAEGKVEIDKQVKGICIDVSPHLLSEVVAGYMRPDTPDLDPALDNFFTTGDFLENKYHVSGTHLGKFLKHFDQQVSASADVPVKFTKELYYTLAQLIVEDHIPVFRQLRSIVKLKLSTKKDLFRRVHSGKEYIDACFLMPLEIADIAKESSLSEYHFFRIFKQVFSISPYQYIIRKRMDFAKELIKSGNEQVSAIAYLTGFADVHSFSKSFKKYMGMSPSQYHEKPESQLIRV